MPQDLVARRGARDVEGDRDPDRAGRGTSRRLRARFGRVRRVSRHRSEADPGRSIRHAAPCSARRGDAECTLHGHGEARVARQGSRRLHAVDRAAPVPRRRVPLARQSLHRARVGSDESRRRPAERRDAPDDARQHLLRLDRAIARRQGARRPREVYRLPGHSPRWVELRRARRPSARPDLHQRVWRGQGAQPREAPSDARRNGTGRLGGLSGTCRCARDCAWIHCQ